MTEMEFGGPGIEEIDHRAARVRTGHDQPLPVVRADESEDRPISRGDVPPHPAVGLDLVRKVDDTAQVGDRLRRAPGHGHDRHFSQIEGPSVLVARTKLRQFGQGQDLMKELGTRDGGRGLIEAFAGVFRRDPAPARVPAARSHQADLQSEPVRLADRMSDQTRGLRPEERRAGRHAPVRVGGRRHVPDLAAAHAAPGHRLQVAGDLLLGDRSVEPGPKAPGPGFDRRIGEGGGRKPVFGPGRPFAPLKRGLRSGIGRRSRAVRPVAALQCDRREQDQPDPAGQLDVIGPP